MGWKQFALAAAIVGLAIFAYSAAESSPVRGPMTPTATGDQMSNPLHRQMVNVFLLPEMRSELSLSPQQTADLRRLKRDLLMKSKDIAGQIAVRRRELDTLLSGDTSRTRTVKALLEKIAELHAQLQYAGFDTSVKMKALLSDAQRTKFNAMKPAELHQLMISHVNMAEMEQAMLAIGGTQVPD